MTKLNSDSLAECEQSQPVVIRSKNTLVDLSAVNPFFDAGDQTVSS